MNIHVANARLSANFNCYASLEDLQKTGGRNLTTNILSDNKFLWELQGSDGKVKSVKIEGFKANNTGLIILKFKIVFEEVYEVAEECTLMLKVEPAQLDAFGERIKLLKDAYDDPVEL